MRSSAQLPQRFKKEDKDDRWMKSFSKDAFVCHGGDGLWRVQLLRSMRGNTECQERVAPDIRQRRQIAPVYFKTSSRAYLVPMTSRYLLRS
jgi:hypothetical protein